MEHLVIRKLKKEDARDVNRINAMITKKPAKDEFKRMVEELAESAGNMSYVAEYQRKVVGSMATYLLSSGFGIEESAWIANLGVEPKFMGQWKGKALASEILKLYSEKNICAWVRWDSMEMLSFFKTLGFDGSNFINLRRERG